MNDEPDLFTGLLIVVTVTAVAWSLFIGLLWMVIR
jgi:hypothetical protein